MEIKTEHSFDDYLNRLGAFHSMEDSKLLTPFMVDKSELRYYEKNEEKQEIVLKKNQVDCCNQQIDVLSKRHIYANVSKTGRGKTIQTLYVAKYFNLPVFVICPVSAEAIWREKSALYDIDCKIITCTKIVINNDYIGFGETTRSGACAAKECYIKETMQQLIDDGTLFVFDEAHRAFDSTTSKISIVLNTLTQAVKMSAYSRCEYLSATLYDTEDRYYRVIHSLVTPASYASINTETEENTENENATKTRTKSRKSSKDTKMLYHYMCNKAILLYGEDVVVKTIATIENSKDITDKGRVVALFETLFAHDYMGRCGPIDNDFKLDVYQGYFNINTKDMRTITKCINDINTFVTSRTHDSIVKINAIMTVIEESKLNDMERVARRDIEEPGVKPIFILNCKENLAKLSHKLKDLKPLVITSGWTSKSMRELYIENFQKNSKFRVLIATLEVICEAISLHDIIGEQERRLYMSVCAKAKKVEQGFGRIFRDGSQSNAKAYIFLSAQAGSNELNVINSLNKKIDYMTSKMGKGQYVTDRIYREGVDLPEVPKVEEDDRRICFLPIEYKLEEINKLQYVFNGSGVQSIDDISRNCRTSRKEANERISLMEYINDNLASNQRCRFYDSNISRNPEVNSKITHDNEYIFSKIGSQSIEQQSLTLEQIFGIHSIPVVIETQRIVNIPFPTMQVPMFNDSMNNPFIMSMNTYTTSSSRSSQSSRSSNFSEFFSRDHSHSSRSSCIDDEPLIIEGLRWDARLGGYVSD